MARSVILSNGRLAVGLNQHGLVHDFYYPYVGLDNLTTARSIHHKIGVWVDGQFSWTTQGDWESSVAMSDVSQEAHTTIHSPSLGITLNTIDFVDQEKDAFCRQVHVTNNGDTEKNVRLFMHQVFEISRHGRADTALYVPEDHYIMTYKGRCTLLISGNVPGAMHSFDQYAVGNYGIEGKEGTFRDAEDGELSGHSVEHAGVDSVIRFSLHLQPGATQAVDYWITASDSQYNGEVIHETLKLGLQKRIDSNRAYWQNWLSIGDKRLGSIPDEYQAMIRKSLMVIKAHIDERGGIIASCDSSIYNYGRDYYSYVWPRDGAYAVWPLIRLGYTEEPKAFFRFCRDVITPYGYLMHKYQPDRSIGSTWHSLLQNGKKELAIQEDETAGVLVALGEFYATSQDKAFIEEMYNDFIVPAATFIYNFIDETTGLPHASFDLWEEKFSTHTYTTAVVYRALITASEFAVEFGTPEESEIWQNKADQLLDARLTFVNPDDNTYRKSILLNEDQSLHFDNTFDISSLYGVITYGYFIDSDDKEIVQANLQAVTDRLAHNSPTLGVPRYYGDSYFRTSDKYCGNPWIITTLWLAQFYIRYRQLDKAKELLDWTKYNALPSGVLSEQTHPETNQPISVTPLVWSHAEFINTAIDYSHVMNK